MSARFIISVSRIASLNGVSENVIRAIGAELGLELPENSEEPISLDDSRAVQLELEKVFSEQKENHEFNSKYGRGSVVEVVVSKIISPSQVYTHFTDGFIGRLSVLDMDYSLPQAQRTILQIKENTKIKCVVLRIDFENKVVVLGQKHLSKPLYSTAKWERIEIGDDGNITVIEDLDKNYLVITNEGIYGMLSKEFGTFRIGDELKVRISKKSDAGDLLHVVPASLDLSLEKANEGELLPEFSFVAPELQNFQSFKRSILGRHASDKELEFIRDAFDKVEKLFSKEIEFAQPLVLQFELNRPAWEISFKQNAMAYFSKTYNKDTEREILEALNKGKYWIRINEFTNNNHRAKQEVTFSLFNEEISIYGQITISKDTKQFRFWITDLTFGHTSIKASEAKKRNLKLGAFLMRAPIRILGPSAAIIDGEAQMRIYDIIRTKTAAYETVNRLKLDAGEILRQEGRTLAIADRFLEYQENLINDSKAPPLHVSEFERTHAETGTTAILIPKQIGDSLELEDEDHVIVKVLMKKELVKFAEGILMYHADRCKLNFKKDVLIDNLKNGFYVEKSLSKRQLQIQREIIQDFLQKKIKIDHIEALLVQPDKIRTPVMANVKLRNPDLIRTEKEQPSNNQVRAIKKAIGNQNIFLIQGPPGTGKTTVIAEIIDQLTTNGKRVLVAGQNHVAVDNVLAKISKFPNLNILRVGNIDRIDKDLGQYHVENLVESYKSIFTTFLLNQIQLLKLAREARQNGTSESESKQEFSARIREFGLAYKTLHEQLKHRHFTLIEVIRTLNFKEIDLIIKEFESWLSSVNTELELLIKPLIYRSVDVVFATCIGIKTDHIFRNADLKFDTVIIDEAGKANIAESLVAIELGKKVILVGDQMQLPPYIDNSLIDERDPRSFPRSEYGSGFTQTEIVHALKTSFFEFLINRVKDGEFPKENVEMLNYQHRMHPNIGEFVSQAFYNGEVRMGDQTHLNTIELPSPFDKQIIFFDTSNSDSPFEQTDGYSAKNDKEATEIAEHILPKLLEHGVSEKSIAIIAPYKSQVSNILRHISQANNYAAKNIDVSTLDSFQGKEYDVIIFSFTRSVDHRKSRLVDGRQLYTKVGFLDDARRLNVAFSRAKKKLILVGNSVTLQDPRSHYDITFNYTELFKTLVRLSKNEKIGNFVNVANQYERSSSFDDFVSKHPVGSLQECTFHSVGRHKESGKPFGIFYKLVNQTCLLPQSFILPEISRKIFDSVAGSKRLLKIHSIDLASRKITVCLPTKEQLLQYNKEIQRLKWIEQVEAIQVGEIYEGKVVNSVNFGYFIKLQNGVEGLLHHKQMRKSRKLILGEVVNVMVAAIDIAQMRISFKI